MHDVTKDPRTTTLARRGFMASLVAGAFSVTGMLRADGIRAQGVSRRGVGSPGPHFKPRARRVLQLCMRGAPSHVDTFDYKPQLARSAGMQGRSRGLLWGSPFGFRQHGESGLWFSELFEHLAHHADELCLLNSMHCDQPNHPQAQSQMHTGNFQFVRPSLGAWILYGLGTVNRTLPGFVTLSPFGPAQNYGSAFLPTWTQGTRLRLNSARAVSTRAPRGPGSGSPIPNLENPILLPAEQRLQLDFIQRLNRGALEQNPQGTPVQGMIDALELAYCMQGTLPKVLDLGRESERIQRSYGIGETPTDIFGRQCLTARRLLEAGVRCVQITHGNWDHHRRLDQQLPLACAEIDKPIAGLIGDLKQRGLLEDTLILWGGEFGRTPHSQNGNGRDHNHLGYTTWMAGAGVRGGWRHGATDELGYEAVENRMHVHDWHATILHLLGLDHTRLTYNYGGRDFRLTDVHGRVHQEILT